MFFFILSSFVFSTDIFLNTSAPPSSDCLYETGCNIHDLLEYSEDTNGDKLYILNKKMNSNETELLFSWLSLKSFSELAIIGCNTQLDMAINNPSYKLILNESIITFSHITFLNISKPFIYAFQTMLTFEYINFINSVINYDHCIKVEGGSVFSALKITFSNTTIEGSSLFYFMDSKIQMYDVVFKKYFFRKKNCNILQCESCNINMERISFRNSKCVNPLLNITNCYSSLKSFSVYQCNITLIYSYKSDLGIENSSFLNSDISLVKGEELTIMTNNMQFHNILSSKILYETENSNISIRNFLFENCSMNALLKSQNNCVSNVHLENGIFDNLTGTSSIFNLFSTNFKVNNLSIYNTKIPIYCHFIFGKNSSVSINNSNILNMTSINNDIFIFLRNGNAHICNTKFTNCSSQIFYSVFSGFYLNNCCFKYCGLSSETTNSIIAIDTPNRAFVLNCNFYSCKSKRGILDIKMSQNSLYENTTFYYCNGIKSIINTNSVKINISQCQINFCKVPSMKCIIKLFNSSATIMNSTFNHHLSKDVPIIQSCGYNNLIALESCFAKKYDIFAIIKPSTPNGNSFLKIFSCKFGKSFPETFHFQQNIPIEINESFFECNVKCAKYNQIPPHFLDSSYANYQLHERKKLKDIKYDNYRNERDSFSTSKFHEYMKNTNGLNRLSPPFNSFCLQLTCDSDLFENSIFEQRDKYLLYFATYILLFIFSKYIIFELFLYFFRNSA